ncbi:acyl transferase/acyl hydrolase/lysophospholipase [Flagelloscypha sp. PMI_526]|nr:acyl transferase/acyl hydrolase/lysophospholipase [Flagelloscypha sp. PMI_526]
MSRIEYDNKTEDEPVLPCQYFDLIVGSGDGGLIALMLGRLGMSAARTKTKYEAIHKLIHVDCAGLEPNAKAQILEAKLRELVREETGRDNPDEERLEEVEANKPRCKVAVLTTAPLNIGSPIILRTYLVRENRTVNCSVWAAMRASMARPTIFPEANVDDQKMISASLGHNNPIESAVMEAEISLKANIDCIISLGSGHPGHIEFQPTGFDSLSKAALDLALGSEKISQNFAGRKLSEGLGDTYFRFNVRQGLQSYCNQPGRESALVHTRAYLQDPAVGTTLDAAVAALRNDWQSERPGKCPPCDFAFSTYLQIYDISWRTSTVSNRPSFRIHTHVKCTLNSDLYLFII